MKLFDIIKKVGGSLIREAIPGGGLILGALNEVLPDNLKLGSGATGDDISKAIAQLSPDKQADLIAKEFDVEITQIKESNTTLRTMLEADAKNPHSTRPRIAWYAFLVVAIISLVVVGMWAYAVFSKDATLVKTVVDGWPWVLAIVGPFVGWLNNYFGTLKQEHKNKLDAANGVSTPSGVAGVISTLLNRK